jgi:hypothetical protein
MVKSPAQSGRLRTLINPGPVFGVHVNVTWRVHWRDTGLIEYYLRRGGNWFEIRNSYGDSIGAAELIPDRQILRLIRTGGGAIGSVKIFDLE